MYFHPMLSVQHLKIILTSNTIFSFCLFVRLKVSYLQIKRAADVNSENLSVLMINRNLVLGKGKHVDEFPKLQK